MLIWFETLEVNRGEDEKLVKENGRSIGQTGTI
jgi:hypothetical protein